MEAVKIFNNELFSLNDYKPPISKAKMTQITKSAIKAIKFYKHVVQSVEKFVQKCKPEYKVPGLYVIDSIVRQSRHQFGQDKDLFAPRFCINIINTFQNLYRCAADDKSKIVRVLNLWQKNNVFKSDIIQPLLDMASGIVPPIAPIFPSSASNVGSSSGRRSAQVVKHWVRSQEFQGTSPGSPLTPHVIMGTPVTPVPQANISASMPDPWGTQMPNSDTLTAVAQILQSPQGQQLQQLVQTLQIQQQKPQPSLLQALDAGLVVQLQALTAQLTAAAASSSLNPLEQTVSLSKRLMDTFDFVDDTDHGDESKMEAPTSQHSLVSETLNSSLFQQLAEHLQQQNLEHLRQQIMEQPSQTITQENQESQESQEVTFGSENSGSPSQGSSQQQFQEAESKLEESREMEQEDMELEEVTEQEVTEEEAFEEEEEEEKQPVPESKSSTPSRSHSRSPRKRRSRSRSGSRKRKHRKRSRSRSREWDRDRKRKTSRSYSNERRTYEREKDRLKKGLPPIRSKTLSVCSTTLWVGQVDRKVTQQDLTNVFEEFGQIESINMIPPRGCAYISMVHRQDAYRALQKLRAGTYKLVSKVVKIAWALNKGVKMSYKQFWDAELGVTYIPWEKVKLDDLKSFAEGGMIDQETINPEWETVKNPEPVKVSTPPPATTTVTITTTTAQSASDLKNSTTSEAVPSFTEATVVCTQGVEACTQPDATYSQPTSAFTQPVAAYTQPVSSYSQPVSAYTQPAAVYTQPTAVYTQPTAVYTQPTAVYTQPTAVYTQPTAVYTQPTAVYTQPTPAYSQPVTLLQMPLAPAVPAVNLIPPVFPLPMSVPPPGYVMPPPPFLRPAFDPSQPPPGYIAPPIPPPAAIPPPAIPPPTVTTSLIQPPLSVTQETMKSSSFNSIGIPATSLSASNDAETVSFDNSFNPLPTSQAESGVKQSEAADSQVTSAEKAPGSAVLNNVSSSSGIQSGPPPVTTNSMPILNMPGHIHGNAFVEGHQGLLSHPVGPRFPFMQPGMPPQRNMPPPTIIDPTVPPPQGPFPPADLLNRTETSFVTPVQNMDNNSNSEKVIPHGNDGIQQEGDRDYRFPPVENREISRPVHVDTSSNAGRIHVDPQEGLQRHIEESGVLGRSFMNIQEGQRLVLNAQEGLLRQRTDEALLFPRIDARGNLPRLGPGAHENFIRLGMDVREGLLRAEAGDGLHRQVIDARQGLQRHGPNVRESMLGLPLDSQERHQRPGTESQENFQRADADSREFMQRMKAGSRGALLKQGADSRDGLPRPGLGPREGLLGSGPDAGQLRIGPFPREGLLGPGPDIQEGLLRLRTFPREGLLGDRPIARDGQGRPEPEIHESHGRPEPDAKEHHNWPGSDAQDGPEWSRSDLREGWLGPEPKEGLHWPGPEGHDAQRRPPPDIHEVLLRLGTHSRDSPIRPTLDMRPHFGRPHLDARQMFLRPPIDEREHFGRPPMDVRETFGRPPMEGREHFGRPPMEGRPHMEGRELFGRPPIEGREMFVRPHLEGREPFVRPPMEGREGFGRMPLEGREHFERLPLEMRENHGRQFLEALGRREPFGFNADKPWGHRDFDERQHLPLPVFGSPQGFHEERERFHLGNIRPDFRGGPMWNRGVDQDALRDHGERKSQREKQRDRDDRDVDFRKETNSNRFRKEREQGTWVPPKSHISEYVEGATATSLTTTSPTPTSSPEKAENVPQINGERADIGTPRPPVEAKKEPELSDELVSSDEKSKEKSKEKVDIEADQKCQPVVESTETKGT
ncbi:SR-related and CTD-associated factor 8 [Lissotriton helveticus]